MAPLRRGRGLERPLPHEQKTITYTHRGTLSVRSWPSPPKGGQHPNSRATSRYFAFINRAFRYLAWIEHEFWREMAKEGPFLPRDFFVQHQYGRLWSIVLDDGYEIFPRQAMSDVSKTLDTIAQRQGALLTRGENTWGALLPGTDGQVLTASPSGPYWGDPSGGGGGGGIINASSFLTFILAETWKASPGALPDSDYNVNGDNPGTLIAKGVTFPETFAEGTLFETGANVKGTYIAWRTVNGTNYLWARAGDGGGDPTASTEDTVVIATQAFPQDNATHELAWAYDWQQGKLRMRIWIDGVLIAEETTTGANNHDIKGSDDGFYIDYAETTDVPGGMPMTSWPGTGGDLYYYDGYLPT